MDGAGRRSYGDDARERVMNANAGASDDWSDSLIPATSSNAATAA